MTARGLRTGPALAALLIVVALGVWQAATAGPAGPILRGTLPYAAAAGVLAGVHLLRRPHDGQRRPRDLDRAWIQGIALAGVVLSGWLVVAFLRALPAGIGQESGFYRVKVLVTSPVGDHNTAAGILLVAAVAAAVAAGHDRRWTVAWALVALGLVATLSRGAVLVLVVVALLAWRVGNRRVAAALTVGAVVALGGVVLAAVLLDASPPPAAAAGDGVGPLGASVTGRVDLAVRGLRVGLQHPVAGVGLGRFEQHAADLPEPNDHAHQLLANAFAEGGLVLLAVALLLPILLFLRVLRSTPSPLRDLVLLAGLALVAHAQIDVLGGRWGYEVSLALLLGLASGLPPRSEPGSPPADASPGHGLP